MSLREEKFLVKDMFLSKNIKNSPLSISYN